MGRKRIRQNHVAGAGQRRQDTGGRHRFIRTAQTNIFFAAAPVQDLLQAGRQRQNIAVTVSAEGELFFRQTLGESSSIFLYRPTKGSFFACVIIRQLKNFLFLYRKKEEKAPIIKAGIILVDFRMFFSLV